MNFTRFLQEESIHYGRHYLPGYWKVQFEDGTFWACRLHIIEDWVRIRQAFELPMTAIKMDWGD